MYRYVHLCIDMYIVYRMYLVYRDVSCIHYIGLSAKHSLLCTQLRGTIYYSKLLTCFIIYLSFAYFCIVYLFISMQCFLDFQFCCCQNDYLRFRNSNLSIFIISLNFLHSFTTWSMPWLRFRKFRRSKSVDQTDEDEEVRL